MRWTQARAEHIELLRSTHRLAAANEGDLAKELGPTLPWRVAEHLDLAGRGVQQPGEDLHRRRFACPVGTDEADTRRGQERRRRSARRPPPGTAG